MKMTRTEWVVALALALLLAIPGSLGAEFSFVKIVELPDQSHGITFDGSFWRIARPLAAPGYWTNYEPDFKFAGTTSPDGVSDIRGMTFDSSAGTLFITDVDNDLILEVTVNGVELQSFKASGPFPEAVAFDSSDETLWIAYFSGLVEQRSRNGVLLDSFQASGFNWSGLAIDPVSDTLLIMEDDDTLYELAKDGTFIAELFDLDQITANGVGLYYDAAEGKLYATDQFAAVAILQDTSRVPLFMDGFESGDTSSWSNVRP